MSNSSPAAPKVPPKVRTAAYFILLAVSVAAIGVYLIAPIWTSPAMSENLRETATAVLTLLGLIAGGLGVAYRPTLPSR